MEMKDKALRAVLFAAESYYEHEGNTAYLFPKDDNSMDGIMLREALDMVNEALAAGRLIMQDKEDT